MSKQSFKKILVTGFEPFDQDVINPSQELLNFLNTQIFEFSLETICLPVTFEHSFEILKKKIEEFNPDFILMTGLAKNRRKMSLEKVAINWIDARIPDNNGLLPEIKKINERGQDGIFTHVDLNQLMNNLDQTKFEISFSAGTYVCNFLYYKVLNASFSPTLFIHLPMPIDDIDKINIFNSITLLIKHL